MKTKRVRSNGTTGAAKPQAKSKPKPHVEYAGKNIVSNFWLKLGLSREELYALKKIAELFDQQRARTTANAAALVLTTALMHWDTLEPFCYSDRAYAKNEGFLHFELFSTGTVAQKFKLNIPVDQRGVVSRNKL